MLRLFKWMVFAILLSVPFGCGTDIKFQLNATDKEACEKHGRDIVLSAQSRAHPAAAVVFPDQRAELFISTVTVCRDFAFTGFECGVRLESNDEAPMFEDITDNDGLIISENRPLIKTFHLEALNSSNEFEEIGQSQFLEPLTERSGKTNLLTSGTIDVPQYAGVTFSHSVTLNGGGAYSQIFNVSCIPLEQLEDEIHQVATSTAITVEGRFSIGL